jgi:hypothetical protein
MKIREIILLSDDQLEGCNTIQRSSSVNIPVVQKRLARVINLLISLKKILT